MVSTRTAAAVLLAGLACVASVGALGAARCDLIATVNNIGPVTGDFTFTERGDGNLDVAFSITGLFPGNHGFHVHTYGDISKLDGTSPTGHFIGNCVNCRPNGVLQEVGMLDDGAPLVADSGGAATGSFIETVAKLEGENGIIGRSIVIHGTDASSGARAAMCVIGRTTDPPAVAVTPVRPEVKDAICVMRPTSLASTPFTATVFFEKQSATKFKVSWDIEGMHYGSNGIHVHKWGDISSATATAVSGHFVGDCSPCRPYWATLQEVGMLWNVGLVNITSLDSDSSATDEVIRFEGVNNIIGRSVVIHRSNDGARIAQCVIGESAPHSDSDDDDDDGKADFGRAMLIAGAALVFILLVVVIIVVVVARRSPGAEPPLIEPRGAVVDDGIPVADSRNPIRSGSAVALELSRVVPPEPVVVTKE